MKSALIYSLVAMILTSAQVALAQSTVTRQVWIQLETRLHLEASLDRIEIYARDLDNVNGFEIDGGWFGVAIGPYDPEQADATLQKFRAEGIIPRTSFTTSGTSYGERFYPRPRTAQVATQTARRPNTAPQTEAHAADQEPGAVPDGPAEVTLPEQPISLAEQLAQAKATEGAMTEGEKKYLQRALAWAGFYESTIDGLYGPGTRSAMTRWQSANGYKETSVLTAEQRAEAIADYQFLLAGLGFEEVVDAQAGIALRLPNALLAPVSYNPPFATYAAKGTGLAQVILISQRGDRPRLAALYEVMQTLSILPETGPRNLAKSSFTIEAYDDRLHTTGFATLQGGDIKGVIFVWPRGDATRRARVEEEIFTSFTSVAGALGEAPILGTDLKPKESLGGLTIRQPSFTQSGVFISSAGHILTAAQDFSECTSLLLQDGLPLSIAAQNAQLAVLVPTEGAAPPSVGRFETERPNAPQYVALGGYSYGGKLGAPSITMGQLQALTDLTGRAGVARLEIDSLPGDIGGPVYDQYGSVIGVLLPPPPQGSRQLPANVQFIANWPLISETLITAEAAASTETTTVKLEPVDLANLAQNTVGLIACWP
ncbi:serine protease [uncultured Planktomarina sp.]|jgi:peptidoglycan hydrolase-like protein with peptidoglycan-binding domain|uniref:serine protease n=1 Tax=uncultured Planktomarina sp. TaxID=1538529 RepID=UPI0032613405